MFAGKQNVKCYMRMTRAAGRMSKFFQESVLNSESITRRDSGSGSQTHTQRQAGREWGAELKREKGVSGQTFCMKNLLCSAKIWSRSII
jgi:hypothetical protein